MNFHKRPFTEVSTSVSDPIEFLDALYATLLEARPYFPGDTNITGLSMDSLLECLEEQGARRSLERD